MKELFYCPGCGGVIDMTHAFCSACRTDISAITGVKRKDSSTVRPPEAEELNNTVADDEDVEDEEELKEPLPEKEQKVEVRKKGGGFGRWLKRILVAGTIALGVWGYQQVGGVKGLKNLISGDGNSAMEQTANSNPDMTVNPDVAPTEVNMIDFAGEWNPESLNPGSTDRMANEHIIIRPDESGTLVIYFLGYENATDLLNYDWSSLEGRKVQCKMSYKDNPENAGLVLLELSADKNILSYSTLDKETSKVKNTHKFQRVR